MQTAGADSEKNTGQESVTTLDDQLRRRAGDRACIDAIKRDMDRGVAQRRVRDEAGSAGDPQN